MRPDPTLNPKKVPVRRFCLIALPFLACCQASCHGSEVSPNDYLGQTPPGMTAQLFFPDVVSTGDGELNSVFSADFREFYFTRRGIPGIPPRIMVSRRGKEGWGLPEPVDFDQRFSAIDLFLTHDGQRMVFCSDRPHDGGSSPREDHDFWVSMRAGGAWSEPQPFAREASSGFEDFYPILTGEGNLFFNSQRDGPGTNNIFRAAWDGQGYAEPEKLPAPINSDFREFDAFVSPKEDLIIFSSDRPGGLGRADIYLSYLEDGRWSEPRNLGAAVNSEASEYGAMLSPDGRFLFFTSSRSGTEDVYWVSSDVLGLSVG